MWACLSPLRYPSREKLLELGQPDVAMPSTVRLTLGVQDVLVLRNLGAGSRIFGQLRVLPGHVFRLPFEQAGDFSFACKDTPSGQIRVQVVAPPDPGYTRLRWRFYGLIDSLRTLPFIAPSGA